MLDPHESSPAGCRGGVSSVSEAVEARQPDKNGYDQDGGALVGMALLNDIVHEWMEGNALALEPYEGWDAKARLRMCLITKRIYTNHGPSLVHFAFHPVLADAIMVPGYPPEYEVVISILHRPAKVLHGPALQIILLDMQDWPKTVEETVIEHFSIRRIPSSQGQSASNRCLTQSTCLLRRLVDRVLASSSRAALHPDPSATLETHPGHSTSEERFEHCNRCGDIWIRTLGDHVYKKSNPTIYPQYHSWSSELLSFGFMREERAEGDVRKFLTRLAQESESAAEARADELAMFRRRLQEGSIQQHITWPGF